MASTYSLYDAKARFSEVSRRVRAGDTVVITYHGKPVAEVRPVREEEESFEGRVRRLIEEGAVGGKPTRKGTLEPVSRRPGALSRFLESRE